MFHDPRPFPLFFILPTLHFLKLILGIIKIPTSTIPTKQLGFWRLPFLKKWIALLRLKWRMPMSALRRHVYIVAKSGSGKSYLLRLLVILLKTFRILPFGRSSINRCHTIILLDPHGEVAHECARDRTLIREVLKNEQKNRPPNLAFISANLQKGIVPNLNPFDRSCLHRMVQGISKKDSASTREVIAQYLTGAFASMLSKGDVKLSFNMETLLTPMMTVLLTISAQGKQMTLFDLKRFLDDEQNTDLIKFGAENIRNCGLNVFFKTTFNEPQFATTKFSLKVKLARLLNSRMFVRLLCQKKSSWDLESLMNSGKTILIDASQSHLGREVSEIYGRTITALAQSYAFLRARKGSKKYCPVFFMIDESSSFISPDIETILTQARKFGLHLILANQMVKQGGMRPELHEAIMGNTALKIVGNAGYTTKHTMSSEMELKKDDISNLSIGNFVIRADGKKAHRVRLPSFWLGNNQLCSDREWAQATKILLHHYYPTARTNTPRPKQKRQRQPLPTKPKFGIASPFDMRFTPRPEYGQIFPHAQPP